MYSVKKFDIQFSNNAVKERGTIVSTPFHVIVAPSDERSACISVMGDRGLVVVMYKGPGYPEVIEMRGTDPAFRVPNEKQDQLLRTQLHRIVCEVFDSELENRKVDSKTINRVCDVLYKNPIFALS